MRRALVLTDDAARHPFRAALPPHVCRVQADVTEEIEQALAEEAEQASAREIDGRFTVADLRRFLQVYCVGLIAVGSFIA